MAINPPYYDWQKIASCENELRAQELADAYFRAYKVPTKIKESEPIYKPPEKLTAKPLPKCYMVLDRDEFHLTPLTSDRGRMTDAKFHRVWVDEKDYATQEWLRRRKKK